MKKEQSNPKNEKDFISITNDKYGNARCVCHFLEFIGDKDSNLPAENLYSLAIARAKLFNGKKYNNKNYGGGIVFDKTEQEMREMFFEIKQRYL